MNNTTDISGSAEPEYDVAIVGLGPTGATLANLLALDGLKVVIFERDRDVFPLPRAVHFDAECMRVFQTIGIADALLPTLFVGPGMKFVNANGDLLIDWTRPTSVGPLGWCASYKFRQPELERTLRKRLTQNIRIDIRLQHDVFALDEREHSVELRFEDGAHRKIATTTARYVVGCDGARSTVRRFMGTELTDLQSHQRWVVVDALLDRDRPDLGDHSIQYCDPARPITYSRGPANHRRWEIMVMPGDDEADLGTHDWLWKQLRRWITPADAHFERSAIYTFHSVVARGWRFGRLLIAGDAAHQTPPFMGQGMAAGIRDASNLAWKLTSVIRNRLPADLLDTYETERAPHVREFIETAVQLGRVIEAKGDDGAAHTDQHTKATIRKFVTPQPSLGAGFHDGSARRDDDTLSGFIAPQPRLRDGVLLDDVVGHRFTLIVKAEHTDAAKAYAESISEAQLIVVTADDNHTRDWLASSNSQAVLVRPDRYVCGLARDVAEIRALIERLRNKQLHESEAEPV